VVGVVGMVGMVGIEGVEDAEVRDGDNCSLEKSDGNGKVFLDGVDVGSEEVCCTVEEYELGLIDRLAFRWNWKGIIWDEAR